jgi:hypothetical protein
MTAGQATFLLYFGPNGSCLAAPLSPSLHYAVMNFNPSIVWDPQVHQHSAAALVAPGCCWQQQHR